MYFTEVAIELSACAHNKMLRSAVKREVIFVTLVDPLLLCYIDFCSDCVSVCLVMLVYCGQTVGWIKMPLGAEVGLGPGDIVLDGGPSPSRKGAQLQSALLLVVIEMDFLFRPL